MATKTKDVRVVHLKNGISLHIPADMWRLMRKKVKELEEDAEIISEPCWTGDLPEDDDAAST